MTVRFTKKLYDHLLSHSLLKLPEEACGLILGEQLNIGLHEPREVHYASGAAVIGSYLLTINRKVLK